MLIYSYSLFDITIMESIDYKMKPAVYIKKYSKIRCL